ncbi:DUF1471 family periplasmic protein YahO [Biostraticola tofi]|nr:DUF1471 family periplasmic protein YahO [Biostraticola tofi]
MKLTILGILLSAFAFSAMAADLMPKAEFAKVKDHYVSLGSITTSGEVSAADAKAELSKMADEKGGDIYVVTSANTKNKMHGTAEVYKKK